MYFLGSNKAGNTYKGNKLENNVRYMPTMLYSIIFITRDADSINNLVVSLGANAKEHKVQRKRYLDTIAQDTVQQHVQVRSLSKSNRSTYNSDDATTTIGSLTQLSSSESNCINNGDTTTLSCRL